MTVTAKILGNPYSRYSRKELRVMRNGCTTDILPIDMTYDGPYWCERHGMVITETIEADTGEKFNVWRKGNELACAIPAREG